MYQLCYFQHDQSFCHEVLSKISVLGPLYSVREEQDEIWDEMCEEKTKENQNRIFFS